MAPSDLLNYKLVIPNNYFQLTFEHSDALVPDAILTTVGCKDDIGDIEQTDLDDIAAAYSTAFLGSMATSLIFERVYASDAGGVVLETIVGDPGTETDPPASLNCAVLVEKRTGISGRRNRGRFYLPIVGEGKVDAGGNLTGAFMTTLQGLCDTFLADCETALGGGSGGLYILHTKSWLKTDPEPADPGNAPTPTQIAQLQVKPKIGTQRRRIR